MNEKDKEIIKSLAALLSKLKKLIQFGSGFFHHHEMTDDKERADTSHPSDKKSVNLANTPLSNDATGENAIRSILKNENLTNQDN